MDGHYAARGPMDVAGSGGATPRTGYSTPRGENDHSPDRNGPEDPSRHNNPFASPIGSGPVSRNASSTRLHEHQKEMDSKYFHSRRVRKGEIDKPWTRNRDPREKWVTIIPIVCIVIGVALAGFLVMDGLKTVVTHQYCPVLDVTDFSDGLDPKVWTKEVELGGFGNGQFEMTTNTDENVFIQNGELVIKPTLQDPSLIEANNVLDLTKQGICTSDVWSNCHAVTNITNGTIINPVKSGRINTKKGAVIKYGRVEVTATLPQGDWLWPAIWMLPLNDAYGPWPKSGEIDIVESRGNNYTYAQGGNNIMSSALHWGPNPANDGWWRTNVKRNALHTTFSKKSHTFGLEWSEKYIFTYIDTRLLQVLYTDFKVPLWNRGRFPLSDSNGTNIVNPWGASVNPNAPFDQSFYLVLNVAVGSTNGWFKDGKSGKPWVDQAATAKKDFWNARAQWQPTWEENGQMKVSKVQIWQQGAC